MKITDVRASLVRHPLPGGFRPTWFPGKVQRELLLTLVEVTTDTGLVGTGAGPARGWEGVVTIETFVSPGLVGQDPFNVEGAAATLRGARLRGGWPWAVEMALWDVIGQACGQPVYRLWGGCHDRLRAYVSLGELRPLEQRLEDLHRLWDEGFRAVKLRFRSDEIREDLKIFAAVRREFGDGLQIMVDANQAEVEPGSGRYRVWDYPTALFAGRGLQDLGCLWLEEPLPRWNLDDLSRLCAALDLPVAGGERNQGMHEFRLLMERHCYDILQGDATTSEGMFQLRKIAGMAEAAQMPFIPHTWSNCIGLAANLQLAASLPNCDWFEYPYDPPGWDHPANHLLFTEPFRFQDGDVLVPQRPGLGFALDREALDRYRLPTPQF